MKPFDLQEALNGAPVKLNNGRKAFVLYDLRKYPFLLKATGRLPINGIMLGNNEDDGDHITWDEFGNTENSYLSIIGMWEEPELTSEQVLEKAYQEDLKVSLDGQDVYIIIGKAKDGSYLLGGEKSDSYVAWCVDFGEPEIYREDIVEPSPKSDTITVTLPKPFKPKPNEKFWFIDKVGADLQVSHKIKSNHALTGDGNYFRTKSDAQAWLDAMKNALED